MQKRTGNENLGRRLRQLRQDRDLKLLVLAKRSGVSVPYLSDIERGAKLPSLDVLARIAKALDIKVVDVLKGVKPYG
jgi:transcriptional regulator with XRE-family HTH domain